MFIKTRKFIGKKIIVPFRKLKLELKENKDDYIFIMLVGGFTGAFIVYQLFFGWYMHY